MSQISYCNEEVFLRDARILAVDDDETNLCFLKAVLPSAGYRHFRYTTDPQQVLPLYEEFQPNLILLDLLMPELDGFRVMEQLSPRIPEGTYLPIVVLTSDSTLETKQRALRMGAKDFLTKPLDPTELLLRIRNLLEAQFLHFRLESQNQLLAGEVRERTRELDAAREAMLRMEIEQKRFCREVLRCVTEDKLHLVDPADLPAEGRPVLELSLTEPQAYPMLRKELREIAESAGFHQESIDDLILAAGEAVTNAIKHAVRGHFTAYLTSDRLIMRVTDQGDGIRSVHLPASLLLRGFSTQVSLGFGFSLMLGLTDRLWVATGPGGTTVQLEKRVCSKEDPDAALDSLLKRFDLAESPV
jgi:DNA-binding response OmpR family regulator/anti-sigma regulatory factor (Ser/Thr protein kinase)